MLGTIKGRRRRGQQRMRWLDDIIDSMDMSLSKLQEIAKDGEARGVAKSQTRLTERLNSNHLFLQCCLLCSANLGMLLSPSRLVLVGQMAHQRSSLYLSMVALSQPSQQAWLTLTAAVRAMYRQVRSKVRGLLCFVSEA